SGVYYPKKNYSFETVDSLGVTLDTTILGLPKESDWIFKAEYLDATLIKNSVTYEMARRMGGYAPRTRFCELLLDGEYIGLYTLTEKVKRDANRVDIAKLTAKDTTGSALTGGYIIEMNINNNPSDWSSIYPPINQATAPDAVEFKYVYPRRDVIQPQQSNYIRNYVAEFEDVLAGNDFTNPATGYRKYIDVKTFIDFLIVNEYSVNYDSYGRSSYLYKEKNSAGGKLKSGPPWDYDRALDYTQPNTTNGWVWEITHPYWPFPFWWSRMWEDERYRKQLACRWTMLRQNVLRTDSFLVLIDSSAALLSEAEPRNTRFWNTLGNAPYATHIDSLKSYVARRLAWLDATLAQEQVSIPNIYLPADTVVCPGTVFDAAALNAGPYRYNWQPGPDTSTIQLSQAGIYHLRVTDPYGCYAQRDMQVSLAVPGPAGFQGQQDNSLTWTFLPENLAAQYYYWNFGDGSTSLLQNPAHNYAATGTYIVTLTTMDSLDCFTQTDQDTFEINSVRTLEQTDLPGLVFPNPFREILQIRLAAPANGPFTLQLENTIGQTVLSQEYGAGTQTASLATGDIPAGAYGLRIKMGDKVWRVRVVRE
ncbi:MAG: CotH kinase family protein, partial [Saprospiraceae bacterium]